MAEARRRFEDWRAGEKLQLRLNDDYVIIRQKLFALKSEADSQAALICEHSRDRITYTEDILFGIKLYEWLNEQPWFSLRIAADPGFWRYLAVAVAPDLIKQRWGTRSIERYFSRTTRIYFGSLWWYVHLSWNENSQKTQTLLLSPNMTSDTITNLVERIGSFGIYVEVYRKIMFCFSKLNKVIMIDRKRASARDIFRSVMKLHMAKASTIDPIFFSDGPMGYVLSLFKEAGLDESDFNQLRSRCYD